MSSKKIYVMQYLFHSKKNILHVDFQKATEHYNTTKNATSKPFLSYLL